MFVVGKWRELLVPSWKKVTSVHFSLCREILGCKGRTHHQTSQWRIASSQCKSLRWSRKFYSWNNQRHPVKKWHWDRIKKSGQCKCCTYFLKHEDVHSIQTGYETEVCYALYQFSRHVNRNFYNTSEVSRVGFLIRVKTKPEHTEGELLSVSSFKTNLRWRSELQTEVHGVLFQNRIM